MEEHNKKLAAIFRQMADCYRYLGMEERFRALAYANASRLIDGMKEDISDYAVDVKTLDNLKGIGESIAEKIIEYLKTGKIRAFEDLKKSVPVDLLELMQITGMGAATTRTLHEKLGINNMDDLIDAIKKGGLSSLPGFGEKKIANIERALKLRKEKGNRMLLGDAIETGNSLLDQIKKMKGVVKAELAGSMRRMKETIGDIDILIAASSGSGRSIGKKIKSLASMGEVVSAGDTRTSIRLGSPDIQVDVRIVNESEFGSALLYLTGSKEHNIRLRMMAKDQGFKINEYGLFDTDTGKRLAGESEKSIYELLGMQFIDPEIREDRGELQAAASGNLPVLVRQADIRGDMQMHSTWSDGSAGISEMARHIHANYPAYEYIVMTDHSQSSRIAGGMKPDAFKRQFDEIDRVNRDLGMDLVKKGVEVDILSNGSLDLPDELLASFDWVTASIHSGFANDNTKRLMNACRHPLVNCIGHPSGRLIGRREAYKVDWDTLFGHAAETGTALEINGQQERLDLSDLLVRDALNAGVCLTVSTDAHDPQQFELMSLGIGVARRGWCSKDSILNTRQWGKVEKFRDAKRSGS